MVNGAALSPALPWPPEMPVSPTVPAIMPMYPESAPTYDHANVSFREVQSTARMTASVASRLRRTINIGAQGFAVALGSVRG
jgi:hypothetical protein